MSHDTNHGHSTENKTIISFKNAFWLVVIIAGLFVAALNFVQAESGAEEHHEGGEAKATTEMNTEATQKENHAQAKPEEHPKAEATAPAADSAKMAK